MDVGGAVRRVAALAFLVWVYSRIFEFEAPDYLVWSAGCVLLASGALIILFSGRSAQRFAEKHRERSLSYPRWYRHPPGRWLTGVPFHQVASITTGCSCLLGGLAVVLDGANVLYFG